MTFEDHLTVGIGTVKGIIASVIAGTALQLSTSVLIGVLTAILGSTATFFVNRWLKRKFPPKK